jgi:hypothetical protein
MSIILTHHAEKRMKKRRMARSDIERVIGNPDKTFPGKKEGTVKFVKWIDQRQHQVVAKLLENKKDWLVLSVWVRGEEDFNWVQWLVLLPFRLLWKVIKLFLGRR